MRIFTAIVMLALLLVSGCGPCRTLWHDEKLPSGRTIKVTSCMLVWGGEALPFAVTGADESRE